MSSHSNDNPTSDSVQLSQSERRTLLEDIANIGLMLGRALSERSLPLRTGATAPAASPLERIHLLCCLSAEAFAVLQAAERSPHSSLRSSETPISLLQSRGSRSTIERLARAPRSAAWYEAAQRNQAVPPNVPRLSEARLQTTHDTPANRFIVTLLTEWEREAKTLLRLADWCGEDAAARRIERTAEALVEWRSHAAWRAQRPLAAREKQGLAAEALRWPTAYRVLFQIWERSRQGLRLDWTPTNPVFALPALEDWHLYEMWCFLQVAAALQNSGWKLHEGDAIVTTTQGIRLNLARGKASRLRFLPDHPSARSPAPAWLTLTYQPLFPSANRASTGENFASRTHAMQPDIALQWHDRLYLLDPKYRSYDRPAAFSVSFAPQNDALLDDINKMHTYRDAITARDERVVQAAWCLFPGDGSQQGLEIVAYPHRNPQHPFGTAGIGAIRLRPGDSAEMLTRLLDFWLHS